MMKANYHTHTVRCKHAQGSEREYVEAAIANGIEILGFSDHAPYSFDDDYATHIRMDFSELEEYVDTLQRLKKEYEKDYINEPTTKQIMDYYLQHVTALFKIE